MRHFFKRALTILALLLIPSVGFCPCGMIGSTGEIAAGTLHASETGHCHDQAGGTHRGGPESPCGSETCGHCPTDLVIAANASTITSLTFTVLPACGDVASTPVPAPSAAPPGAGAADLPPPHPPRPILELNCCF